ncbi:hypothetical protein Leryth_017685 [Lithospermum erythrorhizon]|nr:hypothetical protein Leryth_017685 [Lithospermum erythrorhizon]
MWWIPRSAVTISAESIPLVFTPPSKKAKRSSQFRMKGSFNSRESMISEKDFSSDGAYLTAAVERTPRSPLIERGGNAIAAADIGQQLSERFLLYNRDHTSLDCFHCSKLHHCLTKKPPIVGILTRHDLMREHILGLNPQIAWKQNPTKASIASLPFLISLVLNTITGSGDPLPHMNGSNHNPPGYPTSAFGFFLCGNVGSISTLPGLIISAHLLPSTHPIKANCTTSKVVESAKEL